MLRLTVPIPLSLYVHIPWCVRKCPYCDFNSHNAPTELPERAYVAALLADLEQELPAVWGRRVDSVFIGGGTPSLFSPEAIADLLAGLRARLPLRPDAEITLEANPGTVEQARFAAFRDAGISRLSIGIQSFNAAQLRKLGRIHDAHAAIRAAEAARAAGFDNFNLDLMFGLPGQTPDEAEADLAQAIALQPPHISYYQLTLEPNTLFYQQPPLLPDDDVLWAMQERGQTLLAAHGYGQYEVSAYAQPGWQCRHNRNYWEFGDYLGIGAGAHGKLSDPASGTIRRYWKQKHPREYLATAATEQRLGGSHPVPAAELPFEFMLNALRLTDGFPRALFMERTGLLEDDLLPVLNAAAARELLTVTADWLQPTELGRRFLNDVLQMFMPEDVADV